MRNSGINENEPPRGKGKLITMVIRFARKAGIPVLVVAFHIILIFTITIQVKEKEESKEPAIFKMVDIEEYIPPPPEKEEKKEVIKKEAVEVPVQPEVAETIIETEKEVIETEDAGSGQAEIEFLPQHKAPYPPVFPIDEIMGRVKYPVLASKQKIEGVVYLQLYIDKTGVIHKIEILKEPGYGIGDAVVAAFEGIVCEPARGEDKEPIAVRYRRPVRIKIK
jgi:periplasmic protein TonB